MNGSAVGPQKSSSLLLVVLIFGILSSSLVLPKNAPKSLSSISAGMRDSTRLKGKVVYVDFWASWCVPCRQSLPWMEKLLEKYSAAGLQIVAVNVDRKASAGKAFLEQLNSPLQEATDSAASWKRLMSSVLYDSTGALAKKYDLEALPTSFIYGRDGTLRKQHQGFDENDTVYLDSLLAALLKEK